MPYMPKGKPRVKEIVDAHFHAAGLSPGDLELDVADRSAAAGVRTIGGGEVGGVTGGFLDLVDGSRVPVHRVREIRSKGRPVYRRLPAAPARA